MNLIDCNQKSLYYKGFKLYTHQTGNTSITFPLFAAVLSKVKWVRPKMSAIPQNFQGQWPRVCNFSHLTNYFVDDLCCVYFWIKEINYVYILTRYHLLDGMLKLYKEWDDYRFCISIIRMKVVTYLMNIQQQIRVSKTS